MKKLLLLIAFATLLFPQGMQEMTIAIKANPKTSLV